ncbi:MAG: hypothetical protein AB7G35_00095 [Hyphomicrobiaceae bacterium]
MPRRLPPESAAAAGALEKLGHIVDLINNGGDITLGSLAAIDGCVATASDEVQCLAMLVQGEGESLDQLLRRLDDAIADAYENDRFADEVNAPLAKPSTRTRR